jgi:hypothetical protein
MSDIGVNSKETKQIYFINRGDALNDDPARRSGDGGWMIPDIPSNKYGENAQGLIRNAVLATLVNPGTRQSEQDAAVKLAALALTLAEILRVLEDTQIDIDRERKQSFLELKLLKLQDAEKKLKDARKKEDNSEWYSAKNIFNIVGCLATLLTGAVCMATPGMQVVGALLITQATIQLFLTVDGIVAKETGQGIIERFIRLCAPDASDRFVADCELGIRIGLLAVALLLSVVAFVAMGDKVSTGRNTVVLAVAIMEGVMMIATAGGDVAVSIRVLEGAEMRRDAAFSQAKAKEYDAQIRLIGEFIAMALEQMGINLEAKNLQLDALIEMARTLLRQGTRVHV